MTNKVKENFITSVSCKVKNQLTNYSDYFSSILPRGYLK